LLNKTYSLIAIAILGDWVELKLDEQTSASMDVSAKALFMGNMPQSTLFKKRKERMAP